MRQCEHCRPTRRMLVRSCGQWAGCGRGIAARICAGNARHIHIHARGALADRSALLRKLPALLLQRRRRRRRRRRPSSITARVTAARRPRPTESVRRQRRGGDRVDRGIIGAPGARAAAREVVAGSAAAPRLCCIRCVRFLCSLYVALTRLKQMQNTFLNLNTHASHGPGHGRMFRSLPSSRLIRPSRCSDSE
ncbi:hypothetical protein BS78_03G274100 [Paspalum vaginatum]|nr:hypothetical protein BS78_03G274100 [Paspalum vaginatum]